MPPAPPPPNASLVPGRNPFPHPHRRRELFSSTAGRRAAAAPPPSTALCGEPKLALHRVLTSPCHPGSYVLDLFLRRRSVPLEHHLAAGSPPSQPLLPSITFLRLVSDRTNARTEVAVSFYAFLCPWFELYRFVVAGVASPRRHHRRALLRRLSWTWVCKLEKVQGVSEYTMTQLNSAMDWFVVLFQYKVLFVKPSGQPVSRPRWAGLCTVLGRIGPL